MTTDLYTRYPAANVAGYFVLSKREKITFWPPFLQDFYKSGAKNQNQSRSALPHKGDSRPKRI